MTLSQIMTLALRQLDEDAQDISEYEAAFSVYANIGYDIAVREYLKPKEWIAMKTDGRGAARLEDERILRVIKVEEEENGRALEFRLREDGAWIETGKKEGQIRVLCEVSCPDMLQGTDEPRLPQRVHPALADYICYRHLSSGSIAKQAKAQFFLTSFHRAISTLRPQGMGSVKRYRNLYAVTGIKGAGVIR